MCELYPKDLLKKKQYKYLDIILILLFVQTKWDNIYSLSETG